MQTAESKLKQDFDALVIIEPALHELETRVIDYAIEAHKLGQNFNPNDKWYGFGKHQGEGIKPEMARLVGYSAINPALRSSSAYETAYHYLYGLISNHEVRILTATG